VRLLSTGTVRGSQIVPCCARCEAHLPLCCGCSPGTLKVSVVRAPAETMEGCAWCAAHPHLLGERETERDGAVEYAGRGEPSPVTPQGTQFARQQVECMGHQWLPGQHHKLAAHRYTRTLSHSWVALAFVVGTAGMPACRTCGHQAAGILLSRLVAQARGRSADRLPHACTCSGLNGPSSDHPGDSPTHTHTHTHGCTCAHTCAKQTRAWRGP